MSDFEEPFKISGMWQCSICTHENTTYSSSCELCGVLHDLSLYFNDISEEEDGDTSILEYPSLQDLFLHHLVQSQRLLFSLMISKTEEIQQGISKLQWMLYIRHS